MANFYLKTLFLIILTALGSTGHLMAEPVSFSSYKFGNKQIVFIGGLNAESPIHTKALFESLAKVQEHYSKITIIGDVITETERSYLNTVQTNLNYVDGIHEGKYIKFANLLKYIEFFFQGLEKDSNQNIEKIAITVEDISEVLNSEDPHSTLRNIPFSSGILELIKISNGLIEEANKLKKDFLHTEKHGEFQFLCRYLDEFKSSVENQLLLSKKYPNFFENQYPWTLLAWKLYGENVLKRQVISSKDFRVFSSISTAFPAIAESYTSFALNELPKFSLFLELLKALRVHEGNDLIILHTNSDYALEVETRFLADCTRIFEKQFLAKFERRFSFFFETTNPSTEMELSIDQLKDALTSVLNVI